jgi:hypothetical protein
MARSGSTIQFVYPSALRATTRWDRPVRSSTRTSSRVSPSNSVAAGLKTAFTICGQSAAVRIGFPAKRSKTSRGSCFNARCMGPTFPRLAFNVKCHPATSISEESKASGDRAEARRSGGRGRGNTKHKHTKKRCKGQAANGTFTQLSGETAFSSSLMVTFSQLFTPVEPSMVTLVRFGAGVVTP